MLVTVAVGETAVTLPVTVVLVSADSVTDAIANLETVTAHFIKNRALFSTIRYEDLVLKPREAAMSLCDTLGIGFEEPMLEYRPRQLPGSSIARQFRREGGLLPWKSGNLSKINPALAARWREEHLEKLLAKSDMERLSRLAVIFQYPFAAGGNG